MGSEAAAAIVGTKQIAAALGVSPRTVDNYCASPAFPLRYQGGLRAVLVDELDRWRRGLPARGAQGVQALCAE